MSAVHFTDDNFQKEVLDSDMPVLVDFWAEWCMPCQMVGPVIEELSTEYNGKMKIGKMNVDENAQTPSSLGVMSIPTIMLFKGGKPDKVMVGVQPKDVFKKTIDEILS